MTIATSAFSAPVAAAPTIFDNVAAILRERYHDKKFRDEQLLALIEKYRTASDSSSELNEQRAAAETLLAHVPASHLGLLSEESFQYLVAELGGQPRPTFGFQLLRLGDEFFTFFVLEDGPAALAGVKPWERVVAIDGVAVAESPRLDWAQKDAYLPIDRDPPLHSVLCRNDDDVVVLLEQRRGEQRLVRLKARPYSALEAARASARLMEIDGRTVGYVHFWFIHSTGVTEMLRELFAGEFAKADGLILDLRGRGGNGVVVPDILQILEEWKRPIVALIDRQSRSAKDALAYEFKQRHLATLVGEKTAGAVIPASFAPVGEKTMLMFPSFTLGEYTRKLELKGGVAPDVFVERAGPFSAGNDPILERGKQEMARQLRNAPRVSRSVTSTVTPQLVSPAPAAKPLPELSLPELSDLVRKMTDALGGEKQIRADSHRTLTGTAELIGLPMKGDYVQKASAPNRSLVVMHLGDLVVRQGFDGEVAWSDTPMTGKQIVTGSAADLIRQQAQFYGPLDLVAAHRELTVVGFSIFDGKQCVEIKLVGHGGMESFLYVDSETYFAAGTRMMVQTPIGPVETKTYLRNQRDLGGFITATEIYIDSSVQRQLIKIDKVAFDEIATSEYAPAAVAGIGDPGWILTRRQTGITDPGYSDLDAIRRGWPAQRVELSFPKELIARLPPTRRYLIGVSGGRDSVTLLHLLFDLGYRRLVVCHLDHQLRGRSSKADAKFVKDLATKLQLEFQLGRTDVGTAARKTKQSIETAGRNARYEFFAAVARRRRCRTIFLGHHADDLVETFLLNLFRGAGPTGLGGIRQVATRKVDGVELTIVRPLLGASRETIDAFVKERGLKYRDDATNQTLGPLRNRIRHRVIPYIEKQLGRKVRKALVRAASISADEMEWAETLVDLGESKPELSVKELRAQPRALQRRTLQRWLQARGIADIDFETIERVRALTGPDAPHAKTNLPHDRHARRRAGKLFVE